MEFRKLGPTVVKNTMPLSYSKNLIGDLKYDLQVKLPGNDDPAVVYLKVNTKALFKEEGDPFALFCFETQTEFFCRPIAEIRQQRNHIELYILNAIADFSSLFDDHFKKSELQLDFNQVTFDGIKQQIEEAISPGRSA